VLISLPAIKTSPPEASNPDTVTTSSSALYSASKSPVTSRVVSEPLKVPLSAEASIIYVPLKSPKSKLPFPFTSVHSEPSSVPLPFVSIELLKAVHGSEIDPIVIDFSAIPD